MGYVSLIISTTLTALIGAVVGAVVAVVISATKSKFGKNAAMEECIKHMSVLMLKDQTKQANNAGEITIEERASIHAFAKACRKIGANGETEECEHIVDALPIKHE